MKKILFLLLLPAIAFAQITGKVVNVKDGDTITILDKDSTEIDVRLRSVDCPEKKGGQPFWNAAKQFTIDQAAGKVVTLHHTGRDRYGRTLATVVLPNGDTLNNLLLSAGLAWHYKKYDQSAYLASLEQYAQAHKLGLWSGGDIVAPWLWRKK